MARGGGLLLVALLAVEGLASVRIEFAAFDPRQAMLTLLAGWIAGTAGLVAVVRAPASRVGWPSWRPRQLGSSAASHGSASSRRRRRSGQAACCSCHPRTSDIHRGHSNKAIADRLVVTERTVEARMTAVFGKPGLIESREQHRRILAVLTFLRS